MTATGRFKAVLINGGGKPAINFQSHLTHVRTLVDFLRASGVDGDDIVIFSGDGSDPAADLATRAADSEPDAWLLPPALANRLRPIQFVNSEIEGFTLQPATKAALRTWFEADGHALRDGDTMLLYVTDHGERNKDDLADNTITLWHESLSVTELRELLATLRPGVRVVMLMSQCFSGSFAHTPFAPGGAFTADGSRCGYFASTADRPAYGCYPENRGVDGVGHSHHFFEALAALGRMPEAAERVQITDDSPDVPHATSDFYLQQLVARAAAERGEDPQVVADELVGRAFRERARWEPEIRQMDRIGRTFGMFSPRSPSELELQTKMLPQVSAQLRTYAQRWREALDALLVQNVQRFLAAFPVWRPQLEDKAVAALDAPARLQLARDLLAALRPFTEADRETWDRLTLLKARSDAASAAAYRMEVRLGIVLRMRALLDGIAGRVYLADAATPAERDTYAALRACEDVSFLATPPVRHAAAMAPPAAFPSLDDDRLVVDEVMPAWMGIQFRPVADTPLKRDTFPGGAVAVMTVYPGSAAADAGLEIGDVILGPPDQPFQEPHQIREWTMRREIGEPAPLAIVRSGQQQEITLHPGPYPLEMPALPGPPKIGSAAPPVKLDPFRGDSTFAAGRSRLLFFWATWCAPCKASLPEVLAFAKARNVEVVAITDEAPETLTAFFASYAEPFPETVATDPLRATFQAYAVSGTPTFVMIDRQDLVRYYHSGYSAEKGLEIDGWTYRAPQQKAAR